MEGCFLSIPISTQESKILLEVYENQKKIMEYLIPAALEKVDYYAPLYIFYSKEGQSLLREPKEGLSLFLSNPQNENENLQRYEAFLQMVEVKNVWDFTDRADCFLAAHFAPQSGWMNDPNGFFYKDGEYHLYFQRNPFDIEWGNMTWGHAVSLDLLHWEQRKDVLYPDAEGTMFSGSACIRNDGILFYYTKAGGTSNFSKNLPAVQGIALSTDNGNTLTKLEGKNIPFIEKENRDPQVFYHESSAAYVMCIWVQNDEFAILRSLDGFRFELSDRFHLKDGFECPNLFATGIVKNEKEVWAILTADGYIFYGEFDGFSFIQDTEIERMNLYHNPIPYAAQICAGYHGIESNILIIPWLRTKNAGKCYRGIMGIPRELVFSKSDNSNKVYSVIQKPILGKACQWKVLQYEEVQREECNEFIQIDINSMMKKQCEINIGGKTIQITEHMTLLIDHDIIEIFKNDDCYYEVVELEKSIEWSDVFQMKEKMSPVDSVIRYRY